MYSWGSERQSYAHCEWAGSDRAVVKASKAKFSEW
jgi:hypothetical protein